jgi:hypothetical protein
MEQRKDSRISQSMRKNPKNIKNETEKSSRIRRRYIKRMPGSGGQKNGAEKRFQDQDALYISSRIRAHSVQFENKTSI